MPVDPKRPNKPAHKPSEQQTNIDGSTVGRSMTVYANQQNKLSNTVGDFLGGTIDALDATVREQVQDAFEAMNQTVAIAFVEETMAMAKKHTVGRLEAPKPQFRRLSRRLTQADLDAMIPASVVPLQITEVSSGSPQNTEQP